MPVLSLSYSQLTLALPLMLNNSRLAMLAVVGWPIAELADKTIASVLNLPDALTRTGESPSLLNGGLDKINPFYWTLALSLGALVEYDTNQVKEKKGKDYILGDAGYDFLGLMPSGTDARRKRQEQELKHGRISMLAIVGFAVQEALYNVPVVNETPIFFHPIGFGL